MQIQPRKHVPDRADSTASTRRHELDQTDRYLSALKDLDHYGGIGDVSHVVAALYPNSKQQVR